jgi:transposase-like protein
VSAIDEVDTMQASSLVKKRRSYSAAFKAACVAEARQRQSSVSSIARRHGLNHNLIFKWWREADATSKTTLLPVTIVPPAARMPQSTSVTLSVSFADGASLRIESAPDAMVLTILDRLRAR